MYTVIAILRSIFRNNIFDRCLAHVGCYNKDTIGSVWLLDNKYLFLTVRKARKFKIKAPANLCLVRAHFLIFCHVFTWRKQVNSDLFSLL